MRLFSPHNQMTLPGLWLSSFFFLLATSSCDYLKSPKHRVPTSQIGQFIMLLDGGSREKESALAKIIYNWEEGFIPMLLEVIYLSRDQDFNLHVIQVLLDKTDFKRNPYEFKLWHQWVWDRQLELPHYYADFKAELYGLIDPKFRNYFSSERTTKIRLDEVLWGGVRQDQIPPLRNPKMIMAAAADYLNENDVVFGIEIDGQASAYPKRILAWHEMFVDTINGISVCGVYCTLCGTVILYNTHFEGVNHEFGTSGFLYRSNKLMYDKETQSLWNTFWGQPVIGPLVNKNITLERMSVVTTTWGEWRRRHPNSLVLSLDTGHQRDYSEGAAYREYFASDELMFNVAKRDSRLKNKDEVLGIVLPKLHQQTLAISVEFLEKNPLFHGRIGNQPFVTFTDKSGATRVFESGGFTFRSWDQNHTITDQQGKSWRLTENRCIREDGKILTRIPTHRAFWFGWFAAYPNTELIH